MSLLEGLTPTDSAVEGTPTAASAVAGADPAVDPNLSPQSQTLAPRLQYLTDNHPWMDPQLALATATSGVPTDQMAATANYFKGVLTNSWDGWNSMFDDPVLAKKSSTLLVVKRFFDGQVGPYPVAADHIGEGQQKLQQLGFGRTLPVNGSWSPEWNAAYKQYTNQIRSDQLAGNKPGGTTVGNALRHALGSFLPTKAADAIVGMVASTPHQIRQLAADLAMSAATPVDLVHGGPRLADTAGGFVMGQTPEQFATNLTGQKVLNFDSKGVPQFERPFDMSHAFGQLASKAVSDAGTIMLLGDGLRFGSSVSKAAGEAFTSRAFGTVPDLTYAEAARGPGVIANSASALGRAAFATPIRGAVVGGAAGALGAGLAGQNPLYGAAIGAGVGALGGSDVFEQIPALGRTGAVLGKLAGQAEDDPGLYYKARTLLAQPYRLPLVRALGDVMGETGVYGAKIRGVAALSPGQEMAKAVQGDRTGEAADNFLHRVTAPVFDHKFSLGLNDLMFFLHPSDLGGGTLMSDKVGANASAVVDGLSHALGDTGAIGEAEHGTGLAWPDLVAKFGGQDNASVWLAKTVKEQAAWADAEHALAAAGDTAPTQALDRVDFLRDHARAVYDDNTKMDRAVEDMLSNKGNLASRINRQITNSAVAAGRNPSAESLPGTEYFKAVNLMRDHVLPLEDQFKAGGMMIGDINKGRPDPFSETGETIAGAPMQLGLMKTGLRDRQQLVNQIQDFRDQLKALAPEGPASPALTDLTGKPAVQGVDLAAHAKLEGDVAQFLFSNFGIDATKMPDSLDGKLDKADQMANRIGHRVYPTREMDDTVKGAFQNIHDLGYKVVAGKDIGHVFAETGDEPWLAGPLTNRRRIIEALGLNPDRIETRNISRMRSDGVRSAVQAAVDKGDITLPPLMDVDTLISHVFDRVAQNGTGYLKDVAMTLARGTRRNAISAIADAEGVSRDAAFGTMKDELAKSAFYDLRDVPRSAVVDALTSPRDLPPAVVSKMESDHGLDLGSTLNEIPLMDKASAEAFYRAAVKGAATPGSYMLGASKIEDLARASFGMVGDKITPDWMKATDAYNGTVNLPNRLVQLRNQLRFSLDPYFSFRRVSKINVKLGLEGVTPTVFPLQHMIDNGTFEKAKALLEDIRPSMKTEASDFSDFSDAADRYLHNSDVFGFYDARNYERYAAFEAKQAGKSNDEIDQMLTRTFGYGTNAGEGRSAAERTMNFAFFPFSFDKTLYRNVGGYLLDHPAQQILLDRGLRAYKKFNDEHLDGSDPLAASWYAKHLPILQEASHLNAFAYGLSFGQPAGLNVPLLNLFLPQSWESNAASVKTLKNFVPTAKDFARLLPELADQSQVAYAGTHNSVDDLMSGTPADRKVLWSQPAAEGKYAQFTDAFQMRTQLYAHFANSIAANARQKNSDKQTTFNNPAYGKWNGLPITKAQIDQIVQARYPEYSPVDSRAFAASQQDALLKYRDSLVGTPNQSRYDHFLDYATAAAAKLRSTSVQHWTPDMEAKATNAVRSAAITYAESDPQFYKIYAKHFAPIFGPLEAVNPNG